MNHRPHLSLLLDPHRHDRSVDWYFDFVSPFSYISLYRLKEIPAPVVYKPVLFAGLLKHWGQKGPAEIPAKRRWTYRWCTWWARNSTLPSASPSGIRSTRCRTCASR